MTFSSSSPVYPWRQPPGLWQRRGADASAIRLGIGLSPLERAMPTCDHEGYTWWHYWAECPQGLPEWERASKALPLSHALLVAKNGEHAWHRLALHGRDSLLKAWQHALGTPDDTRRLPEESLFLHCAAWSGSTATVQFLAALFPDALNLPDKQGLTPAMIAAHRLPADDLLGVIAYGVDMNVQDKQGRTLVHHVAQHGNPELVEHLLDLGGDGTVCDVSGNTPAELGARQQFQEKQQDALLRHHWWRRSQQMHAF